MIKATRVGNTVICVIGDKMLQKTFNSDAEIMSVYELALNTDENNIQELEKLKAEFLPPLTKEQQEIKAEVEESQGSKEERKELLEWMDEISRLGDEHFEVNGIKLYMKGIDITVPEFLAREFASRRGSEEDTNSLVNFWRLLALNPDPRTREDLYKFLIRNNMTVTPSGYFVAYRNARVKKEGNFILNQFIADQLIKIKNWKKSPKNYMVLEDEDGNYSVKELKLLSKFFNRTEEGYTELGTVQDLYDKMQENREDTTVYTDAHSGRTTIIIGQPVSIPRDECDSDPDITCSRGLHLGSSTFMRKGYFGEVGLTCLCNPMHVVAVPYTDGQKLRTSEYLPAGLANYDKNGKLIPLDTATLEYEYGEHTEEQLEEMLNNARFESLKEHKILPLEITYESLRQITEDFALSTDEMKKVVMNRVKNVE
jgi:hypothetical protein